MDGFMVGWIGSQKGVREGKGENECVTNKTG